MEDVRCNLILNLSKFISNEKIEYCYKAITNFLVKFCVPRAFYCRRKPCMPCCYVAMWAFERLFLSKRVCYNQDKNFQQSYEFESVTSIFSGVDGPLTCNFFIVPYSNEPTTMGKGKLVYKENHIVWYCWHMSVYNKMIGLFMKERIEWKILKNAIVGFAYLHVICILLKSLYYILAVAVTLFGRTITTI